MRQERFPVCSKHIFAAIQFWDSSYEMNRNWIFVAGDRAICLLLFHNGGIIVMTDTSETKDM
jgi:hypothetical protein